MNTKFLRIVAATALLSVSFLTFAEEKTEEKKAEFPGKFGLEFKQTMQSAAAGNRVIDTEYSEAAVYSKTEFKAKIDFALFDKLYTVTPWVKERLDLYFNPNIDPSSSNELISSYTATDSSGDTVKYKVSNNKFDARNRFELGLDNTFNISDMIKIGVNPAFRFENKLTATAKDTVDRDEPVNAKGDKFGAAAKFVFMPTISLGYNYKFGLNWCLLNTVYIHTYPIMGLVANNSIVEKIEYEGTYDLGFDVLKAMSIKNYSFSIFGQEYIDANFLTDNYKKKLTYNDSKKTISGDFTSTTKLGMSVGIFDLCLKANGLVKMKSDIDDIDDNNPNAWTGIQLGSTFKKNNWEIGVEYTGMQQFWYGTAINDEGTKYKPRLVEAKDLKYWENTVEAYFKVKM